MKAFVGVILLSAWPLMACDRRSGGGSTDLQGVVDLGLVDGAVSDGRPWDGGTGDAAPPDGGQGDLGVDAATDATTDVLGPSGCGSARTPYSGSLCGPPSKPCKAQVQELLPNPAAFRNDGPGLALDDKGDVNMLFSVASMGYKGFHARRDASGTWTITALSMALATSVLVRAHNGTDLLGLIYDGTPGGAALYRYSGGNWTVVDNLPAFYAGWVGGMLIDQAGCLHASLYNDFNKPLTYGRRKGSWETTPLGMGNARGPVGLSPAGVPHLAYFSTQGGATHMMWSADTVTEQVTTYGNAGVSEHEIALGVTHGPTLVGTPHLLFSRMATMSGKLTHELVYATRSAGTWDVLPVAVDGLSQCDSLPKCSVGATCAYDYDEYSPLAVATSGNDDVRLLLARVRHHGQYVGEFAPNQAHCGWKDHPQDSGTILVGWISGGAVSTAVAATGIHARSLAAMEMDSSGRMHLGMYVAPPSGGTTNTQVQYVRLGP